MAIVFGPLRMSRSGRTEWGLATVELSGWAFCRVALRQALAQWIPDIFNTDQGPEFMAEEFTRILEAASVWIGMDGRGRALDNVFAERLCRTVKLENI